MYVHKYRVCIGNKRWGCVCVEKEHVYMDSVGI